MRWIGLGVGTAVAAVLSIQQAYAASPLVQAAESSVYLDAGGMDTQYHENFSPPDDETGLTGGFSIGASVLEPLPALHGLDFYAALDNNLNLGTLNYNGQTESFNGTSFVYSPYKTIDKATFDRVAARIGLGIPSGGAESIPYITAGYQIWSRNDQFDGSTSTETYHAALVGGGYKLDIPLGKLVLSATGEVDGIVGGSVTVANPFATSGNLNLGFGISPEERLELAADDAIALRFHLRFKAFVEHFSYAGSSPQYFTENPYVFYIQEPSSTTTQYGADVGFGYSF